ncbi:MAG: hypothetical protein SOY26_09410, partial [Paludibacteraceae bacterium]|nr:hypothetical protein [Paludibacteraceae bacterium]
MKYNWTFANVGGSVRVKIQSGEDIRHLGELDQKMWTVLSCPTTGLEINEESLSLIDLDGDGKLRVKEVVQTADWLCSVLLNPDSLLEGKSEVALDNIADESILSVARQVAGDKERVSLGDVDAAIAGVSITAQPAPEVPYAGDVIAAYKAKQAEYAAYYEQVKLQQIGLATIAEDAPKPGMTEEEFAEMGSKIAAYEAGVAAANDANAAALSAAQAQYKPLRKLLLLSRDFYRLLRNFVTFEDFYDKRQNVKAIFQAGTLIIDQRACTLCVRVSDIGKHNLQAGQSGMFLIYCDCESKKLGQKMQIVAAMTIGDIRNLKVGKNALFYDNAGNDWDAVVTKIIDNPISISQAFWSPYRKLGDWISNLINKSASEKNDKAFAEATAKIEENAKKTPEENNKVQAFDIAKFAGIFAAFGMAIGYIGAFFTSLGKGFGDLAEKGWYMPILAIIGLMLVISGPAMIMAWIKLRKRNLTPLLNANGWAINADAVVSVMFGTTLTQQAQFPMLQLVDPLAKKGMPAWKKWIIAVASVLVILLALCLCFANFCCKAEEVEPVVETVESAE